MDVHDVHAFEAAGDAASLLQALGEPEPRVRQEACYALGQLANTETVVDLAARLADDDHESVRAAAAESLGWLRQASAVPQLIRAFLEDPDDDVRTRAAAALGSVGDPAAIPVLEAEARTHLPISFPGLHRDSQLEAIRSLGTFLPDPAARAALEALEPMGGEIGKVARQALLPAIVWGAYHQEALRHLVTEAGWRGGGWRVAAELRADPENAYDPDAVAVVAVASGAKIGYLRRDYAADLNHRLRTQGPMACAVEIHGGRRLGAFMVALGAEAEAEAENEVTQHVHGNPLRDEAFAHLMSCVSPEMTTVCLRHLGTVSDAADAAVVTRYLERREPGVRAAAADVLGDWRAADAVPQLAALLADHDGTVRHAVSRALELIDTEGSREALAKAAGGTTASP